MGKVDEVLGELLRKLGLEGEVARQSAVDRWPEVVGERIASVARARGQARGALFVDVRSSAWLNELNLMRHDLLARLNAGAGEARIERIVFRLAEDGALEVGGPGEDGPERDAPGMASDPESR